MTNFEINKHPSLASTIDSECDEELLLDNKLTLCTICTSFFNNIYQ